MLDQRQQDLCSRSSWDFSDLRALFINCTLKPSPELSHTQGLIDVAAAIMATNGIDVEVIRAVDHSIAPGVYPDMTERGAEADEWPAIYDKATGASEAV